MTADIKLADYITAGGDVQKIFVHNLRVDFDNKYNDYTIEKLTYIGYDTKGRILYKVKFESGMIHNLRAEQIIVKNVDIHLNPIYL
jgi:hypothetical protein